MQPWTSWLMVFVGILFRMAGFMIFAPFFGSRNIPVRVKALLAVALALLVFPSVFPGQAGPDDLEGFVALAAFETAVGVLFGFASSLAFAAIQLGGHLIGQKMGFAMASVVDPFTEAEVTLVEEFKFYLAVFTFLVIGGHYFLVRALVDSFRAIPVGGAVFRPELWRETQALFGAVFAVAVQVAAPVVAAMFLVTLGMGFLARAVPQINVMMVYFPLQILVGTVFLVFFLPVLAEHVLGLPEGLTRDLRGLTRLLAP